MQAARAEDLLDLTGAMRIRVLGADAAPRRPADLPGAGLRELRQMIGHLVAGAAITETIFAIPGVGRAAVDAIFFRDFPVLQGAVIVLTLAVMVANLLADVAYAYFDPRIRFS